MEYFLYGLCFALGFYMLPLIIWALIFISAFVFFTVRNLVGKVKQKIKELE